VYFHPQYFTWFVLFLVVVRATEDDRVLTNVYRLQMWLFVPYTFYFGSPLFGLLLAPLDRDFFLTLSSPWDWITAFGRPELVLGLARSALSAACLFMVGWLLFGYRWREAAASRAAMNTAAGELA